MRGRPELAEDLFSGVAQSLLSSAYPRWIAMQFEISDIAETFFAREFYRAIAEGNPVDAAMCESRKALFREECRQEWATPPAPQYALSRGTPV